VRLNEFAPGELNEAGVISAFAKGLGLPQLSSGNKDGLPKEYASNLARKLRSAIYTKKTIDANPSRPPLSSNVAGTPAMPDSISGYLMKMLSPEMQKMGIDIRTPQTYAKFKSLADTVQKNYQNSAASSAALLNLAKVAYSMVPRSAPVPVAAMPVGAPPVTAAAPTTKPATTGPAATTTPGFLQSKLQGRQPVVNQRATPEERSAALVAARAKRTGASESKQKPIRKWGEK